LGAGALKDHRDWISATDHLPIHAGTGLRRRPNGYPLKKRALDVALCTLAMPVVLPILIGSAIAVKATSRGPVFFVQERTGWCGRRFRMIKFRTMVEGAHAMKAELADQNVMGGPDFKLANDPRVTRVGSFLRRTSLDELPQIINILKGDMSLVGPRPTSFAAETYELWHTERLEVIPGLTGLWQVRGRGDIDFDDRVRLDIAYVRNRSMALDFSLLLRTIPAVLSQRGAF
jgi:lipopolysaccharide/colanic/teichoic acid biosynthesis glycosyltransferase